MRQGNRASPGGVGGAAGPEPGDVNGGGNGPVNAEIPYISQAENTDNLRDYWKRELDTTLGWLVRIPPVDYEKRLKRFRRGYGRFIEMARNPRAHPEIREVFSKVWNRWRRRSPTLYPEELRDQIFTEAEIEIGVLRGQCLDRRIDSKERLVAEIAAWERQRNTSRARIKWMSTTEKARDKMGRAYPKLPAKES